MNNEFEAKRNLALITKEVNQGHYVPKMHQLALYGRRHQPTRFERLGLWITEGNHVQAERSRHT